MIKQYFHYSIICLDQYLPVVPNEMCGLRISLQAKNQSGHVMDQWSLRLYIWLIHTKKNGLHVIASSVESSILCEDLL